MELAKVKRLFEEKDLFAQFMGMEIVDAAPGYAKVRLELREHHLNGVKTAHGGVIFSLADYAFAIASNSHGRVAVGIDTSISYMKAAVGGVLTAEAKEISLNPRLGNYLVHITDEENNAIAVFQGTAYRKKEEWQWD